MNINDKFAYDDLKARHDAMRERAVKAESELAEAWEAILGASAHQPMYNGRPSCPFCDNFVDDEETHHPRCIVVSVRAALEGK